MQLEAARFYVISRQGLTVLAAGTFVHVSLVQVLMLELVPVAAVGQSSNVAVRACLAALLQRR